METTTIGVDLVKNVFQRAADACVATGRADMGTKAAVRLALELGQRINRTLAA